MIILQLQSYMLELIWPMSFIKKNFLVGLRRIIKFWLLVCNKHDGKDPQHAMSMPPSGKSSRFSYDDVTPVVDTCGRRAGGEWAQVSSTLGVITKLSFSTFTVYIQHVTADRQMCFHEIRNYFSFRHFILLNKGKSWLQVAVLGSCQYQGNQSQNLTTL